MEVDPKFQQAREKARKRRVQRRNQRIAILGGGAVLAIALGVALFGLITWLGNRPVTVAETEAGDLDQFVQVETEAEANSPPVRAATPFVDIAGDPMILRFETGNAETERVLAGPPTLDAARVGGQRPDRLTLVQEPLIVQERQLITALPSSREDFVFFQAQRSASLNARA